MIKILNNVNERIMQTLGIVTPNSNAIECNGILVGIIDYIETDTYVKIMYITINDEYRKCGIAKEVITQIKEANKGKYMYGDSLPGVAMKFWKKMGAEFDEDEDEYLTPFHIEC